MTNLFLDKISGDWSFICSGGGTFPWQISHTCFGGTVWEVKRFECYLLLPCLLFVLAITNTHGDIVAAPPPFSQTKSTNKLIVSLILNVIWSPNNVFQVRRRDASLSRWQGARSEANQKVRCSQSGCCSVLQYHWTWTTCIKNFVIKHYCCDFFVVQ